MSSDSVAVFDLDGTLIDAFSDIAAAINRPLAARGVAPHGLDKIHEWVGDGAGKLIERATPPEFHHELAAVRTEMMAYYREHPADLATIYDGALDVLDGLRARGVRLAILSNKPHDVCLVTCDRLGLTPYFDVIQGEHPANAPRKPDPGALLGLLDRMGAGRAVMIGDGNPDGEVAQRARIPFIACLWGTRSRAQLATYAPVAFAEKPAELQPLIEEILALPSAANS